MSNNKQLAEPYSHWIGMAGLHGYMPNMCNVYDTKDAAICGLLNCHDYYGGDEYDRLAEELSVIGTAELDLEKDGNAYCSIHFCECTEPWVHEEYLSADEWLECHTDDEGNELEVIDDGNE